MSGGRGPVGAPRGHRNVSGTSQCRLGVLDRALSHAPASRRPWTAAPPARSGTSHVLCRVCGLEGGLGAGSAYMSCLSQLCPQGPHSVSLTLTLMGALTPWDLAEATHRVLFSKSPSRALAGASPNIIPRLSTQTLCSEAWSASQLRPRVSG